MDRIQKQASDLWALLFDEETAETYQSALNLTGKILTDTAQLIWLIICSVFVFGAWFSDASVKAGTNIRNWVDQQANSKATGEAKPVSETGKDILDSSRIAIVKLLNRAREELGLEAEPIAESPTKKAIMPNPSAAPTAKIAASEPTTAAPASQPSASPSSTSPYSAVRPSAAASSTASTASAVSTAPGQSATMSAHSAVDLDDTDDTDEEIDDSAQEDETWPPQTADD